MVEDNSIEDCGGNIELFGDYFVELGNMSGVCGLFVIVDDDERIVESFLWLSSFFYSEL